ncbi:hypothetical protein BDA99DRAFT_526012 [Phascolomyces articulosus]|uniref:Uncharacterized protein n=1 Tax=Phascolomyces articulosus TaxID=60185 RepID=A0AAD5JZX2_9FUNG|nr:hypothetical protein BDA99DRAFT_526012 [Phascolomyces articulosus]
MMNSHYESKKKKPKPLFGLFRTGGHNSTKSSTSTTTPSSSISTPPPTQQQHYQPTNNATTTTATMNIGYDPYEPVHRSKPIEVQSKKQTSSSSGTLPTRRPRSKSTAATGQRVTMSAAQRAHSVKVREQALNKLCGTSPTPSPSTSSPRSSPFIRPPMPRQFTPPSSPLPPRMKKHASANDLRQANRHQFDAIYNSNQHYPVMMPVPSNSTSRTGSPQRMHSPRIMPSQHSPRMSPHRIVPSDDSDSDDDLPLAVTMGTTRNNLLLDHGGEEDEDDKDLVPIATALSVKGTGTMLSAADKYKQKVKEQLDMSNHSEDDDDVPISTMVSRRSMRAGRRKRPGLQDTTFLPQAV